MLEKMNHPERALRAVHIAGTNGKGSTLTYIKQALIDLDYTVGSFVSPSMEGLQDHIFIQHESISDQNFLTILNELYPIVEEMDRQENGPTEFEIIVMIALLYFKGRTDLVLIEAGMGGKEDSTNVLTPILSIITNIGLDHMNFLGNTVGDIARQKAGIIKEGVPVVTGVYQSEAKHVIQEQAFNSQAPLHMLGTDFMLNSPSTYKSNDRTIEGIRFGMSGSHQNRNGALAVKALELILPAFDPDKVKESLAKARLIGRFEQVFTAPTIVLDGAHNEEGVKACMKTTSDMFPNHSVHVLFGAFKDKRIEAMMTEVSKQAETVTLTSFDHPRAATLQELETHNREVRFSITEDWKTYIKYFIQEHQQDVLLVTGSLHFISKIRHFLSLFD